MRETFDERLNRVLNGGAKPEKFYIEEGMILSINSMVSDAIAIPSGDYTVWMHGDMCALVATESPSDVFEVNKRTLEGFFNPDVHTKTIVKPDDAIVEGAQ